MSVILYEDYYRDIRLELLQHLGENNLSSIITEYTKINVINIELFNQLAWCGVNYANNMFTVCDNKIDTANKLNGIGKKLRELKVNFRYIRDVNGDTVVSIDDDCPVINSPLFDHYLTDFIIEYNNKNKDIFIPEDNQFYDLGDKLLVRSRIENVYTELETRNKEPLTIGDIIKYLSSTVLKIYENTDIKLIGFMLKNTFEGVKTIYVLRITVNPSVTKNNHTFYLQKPITDPD